MTTHHPGGEIAGYRIESLIGRGGMAVVYRAEDMRLGRKVALKLLPPELVDNDLFRRRFILESRLAASLDHPNIVPIYEAGEADGQLFIAMRYVVGSDLKAVLTAEGGPLPDERTLTLVGQVGDALDAAHRAGLVHRDVKPGNILIAGDREHPHLTRGDHAYLTDFGLTKRTNELSAGLTGTGHFLGTVDYVAPEQIQGKQVGPATDIYALGCVLFECLTGQLPFARDDDAALLWAHLTEMPPPIAGIRPELPAAVGAVVARAMAKNPADRYGSCEDLVRALEQSLGAPAAGSFPGAGRSRPSRVVWGPPGLSSDGALAAEPGTVAGDPAGGSRHPSAAPVPSRVSVPVPAEAAGAASADRRASSAEHTPRDRSGAGLSPSTSAASSRPGGRRRLVTRLVVVLALALAAGVGALVTNLLTPVNSTAVAAEPATSPAPDPFTPPPGSGNPAPGSTSAPVSPPAGGSSVVAPGSKTGAAANGPAVAVSGDAVGLYGGTGAQACDVGVMAAFLESHPDRAAAWARAEGIRPSDIGPFLASLTPVVLRTDTAVTNHGFRNGVANAFQSVLQAGTAVLVDEHGVPRVRCACGNPLQGPTARQHVRYTGQTWPELARRPITVIRKAPVIVQQFILVVVQQNTTVVLDRPRGSDGDHDRPAPPAEADKALKFTVPDPADDHPTDGKPRTDETTPDTGTTPATPPSTPPTSTGSTSSSGSASDDSTSSGSTTSSGSASDGSTTSSSGSTTSSGSAGPDTSTTSSGGVSSGGNTSPDTGTTSGGTTTGPDTSTTVGGGASPDGSSTSSGGVSSGGNTSPDTGTTSGGGGSPAPGSDVVPQAPSS